MKFNTKFDAPIQIQKAYVEKAEGSDEKWIVDGYATTDDLDSHDEIITLDAIKGSENDLIENSTVLYNHDIDFSIGKVLESKADKVGLRVKVLISKTMPDIWKQIQEGVLNKFSIRGRVIEAVKEFVESAGKTVRVIKAMELLEVSLVPLPANSRAKAMGWYIEKALREFEGGDSQMKKQSDELNEEQKMEELRKKQAEFEKEKKLTPEEIQKKADDEAAAEAVKKAAKEKEEKEETSRTTKEKETEDEDGDGDGDDAKKQFSQSDVDAAVSKAVKARDEQLNQMKKQLDDVKNRLDDKEAEAKTEKLWSEKYCGFYSDEDAPVVKKLLKKMSLGQALSMDETNSLIEKRLTERTEVEKDNNRLPGNTDTVIFKGTKTREELLKLGGIRVRKQAQ